MPMHHSFGTTALVGSGNSMYIDFSEPWYKPSNVGAYLCIMPFEKPCSNPGRLIRHLLEIHDVPLHCMNDTEVKYST